MTNQKEIYKCEICGNIVEVLHSGNGTLVCCGENMILQEEKTQDPELGEKHVPVVKSIGDDRNPRVRIKVGDVEHPMTPEHYIEWIEIITPDRVLRKFLKPGEKPEKEFTIRAGTFETRIYCNLHGLWKKEK
ncbi:desulfoferrodoxin [Candidatus Pacearchaeota archaeon]|nr:desulfoferrodoxin [Candidatus Pacearchaeota archaeon]